MCMCVSTHACMCAHEYSVQGQKMASDPLELKFQALVICLPWVLGTKLRLEEQCGLSTAEPSLQPQWYRF